MCYVKTKADQKCRNLVRPVYLENCQQPLLTIAVYINENAYLSIVGKCLNLHICKNMSQRNRVLDLITVYFSSGYSECTLYPGSFVHPIDPVWVSTQKNVLGANSVDELRETT